MFKAYSNSGSLVITSRWFATSRLVAPVSVRLVYKATVAYLAPWSAYITIFKQSYLHSNTAHIRTRAVSSFKAEEMPTMNHIDWTYYNDVIMGTMASQITSLTIVYSTVYSRRKSKKHQSSTSMAFVRGIHRWPVNSPHKGPVTRIMFPFDDVITNQHERLYYPLFSNIGWF